MCCFPLLPQSHIHPISIHIPVFLAAYSWVAGTPARWIGIHLTRLMTRSVQGNSSQAVEHQSATGRGNCSLSIHCKKSKCHLWGVISYIYILYYYILLYTIHFLPPSKVMLKTLAAPTSQTCYDMQPCGRFNSQEPRYHLIGGRSPALRKAWWQSPHL